MTLVLPHNPFHTAVEAVNAGDLQGEGAAHHPVQQAATATPRALAAKGTKKSRGTRSSNADRGRRGQISEATQVRESQTLCSSAIYWKTKEMPLISNLLTQSQAERSSLLQMAGEYLSNTVKNHSEGVSVVAQL